MYCNECGKSNPDGAKFCAYCGARLLAAAEETPAPAEAEPLPPAEEAAVDIPAPEQEQGAIQPEPAPERPAPARQVYPAGHIVRPLADNPAQPARPGDARAAVAEPAPEPVPEPVTEPAPAPAEGPAPAAEKVAAPFRADATDDPFWADDGDQKPFSKRFFTPKPDDDEPDELDDWPDEDDEPARQPASGGEGQAKERRRFKLPGLSPEERRKNNMVLTSSGTEEMPARKPPVSREKRDTMVPERVVPDKKADKRPAPRDDEDDGEDIFFMKTKKKAPRRDIREEEDAQDDAYVNSRVRLILAGIAFVVCLSAAFWLFATQSGRVFRAGFGLSDDPAAYRILGDTALANNQVKRAADAYYQALALDPDDYATALLVGVTQQQIGNYDQADRAYQKCISLRPTDPEPYEYIIRLNVARGDEQRAEYFRQLGRQQTGRSDLGA